MSIFAKRILGTFCWLPFSFFLYGLWSLGLHDPVRAWLQHVVNTGAPRRDAAIISLILAAVICAMFFPYYWLWFIYGTWKDHEQMGDQAEAKHGQNNSNRDQSVQLPKTDYPTSQNSQLDTSSEKKLQKQKFNTKSGKFDETLYTILGVSERAKDVDIVASHRKLVQRWHSDKHFGYQSATDQRLTWLNRAKEVLADPKKRAQYDRQLSSRRNNK